MGCVVVNTSYRINTHFLLVLCVCVRVRRYSRGPGAVLFGPEFGPPVWRVSVHTSAARIHVCHSGRDQGALQDTGEPVHEVLARRRRRISQQEVEFWKSSPSILPSSDLRPATHNGIFFFFDVPDEREPSSEKHGGTFALKWVSYVTLRDRFKDSGQHPFSYGETRK